MLYAVCEGTKFAYDGTGPVRDDFDYTAGGGYEICARVGEVGCHGCWIATPRRRVASLEMIEAICGCKMMSHDCMTAQIDDSGVNRKGLFLATKSVHTEIRNERAI